MPLSDYIHILSCFLFLQFAVFLSVLIFPILFLLFLLVFLAYLLFLDFYFLLCSVHPRIIVVAFLLLHLSILFVFVHNDYISFLELQLMPFLIQDEYLYILSWIFHTIHFLLILTIIKPVLIWENLI